MLVLPDQNRQPHNQVIISIDRENHGKKAKDHIDYFTFGLVRGGYAWYARCKIALPSTTNNFFIGFILT